MAAKLSPDSKVIRNGEHKELTPKEYSFLIRSLDNNLIRKDVRQLKFLCADFFEDKKFLAKEDITAHDIFSLMKRNGIISNEDLTLLSQLMLLLGKKKLQRQVLFPHNIVWKEGMETSLSKFRLMLFRLYQDTRKEDFDEMKKYCSLRLDQDLPRAELERVTNALELFTVLIDHTVISADDVDYLCDVVETLRSKRMLKLAKDYKESMSSRDKDHHVENKLSEVNPRVPPTNQNLRSPPLIGSSSSRNKYSRLSSTETSYMDEKPAGSSLVRPTDFFKRNDDNLSMEDKSLTHPIQVSEAPAVRGMDQHNSTTAKTDDDDNSSLVDKSLPQSLQNSEAIGGMEQPNSTTEKTAEIEKKLKDLHLPTQEERSEIRQRSGGTTVTSGPDDTVSMKHSLDSEQFKNMQLSDTEGHGILKGAQESMFPLPNLTESYEKDLPPEMLASSSNPASSSYEKGDASATSLMIKEGATALPCETHGKSRNPQAALEDEKNQQMASPFTSREMLEGMDPNDLNFTARTEKEETELNKLKKSECSSAATGLNSRESTVNDMRSVHHPPPLGRYKMSHIPRGKCLILTYDKFDDPNLKDREGNKKDIEALIPLFKDELQFEVEDHLNLDYKRTMEVINKVARGDHRRYDCFVLIFCSHGNESAVFTRDSVFNKDATDPKGSPPIYIQDLLTPFKAEHCKSLAGKPKIFFINSCRRDGIKFQEFVRVKQHEVIASDGPESGVASNLASLVPTEADFCVALSTVQGYSSARAKKTGTIYTQSLADVLKNYYKTCHLLEILTEVNKDLKVRMKKINHKTGNGDKVACQVSPFINTLDKCVYFA